LRSSRSSASISNGLNGSPMGLAAWIVEKFRAWSDCNGEIERRFSKDELLTNIMIYGVAIFPKETIIPPRELAERFLHVERWTEMP
jgi:hypothetical protein